MQNPHANDKNISVFKMAILSKKSQRTQGNPFNRPYEHRNKTNLDVCMNMYITRVIGSYKKLFQRAKYHIAAHKINLDGQKI